MMMMMMMKKLSLLGMALMVVAGFGLTMPVAGFAECPADIVAYWKLDEGTGETTYADYIGDNAAEVNAPNTPPTAMPSDGINGAQLFGGPTSGIDVPASKAFNWSASESFSVELWVKTDVTPTANKVLVGRGQSALDNVFWWVGLNQDDGKPAFLIREADNSNRKIIGSTVLSDNRWYHVVATRNGETDEQSLYVNGNLEAVTLSQTGNMLSGLATPDVLSIGYVDDGSRFTGLIDEVAIYDGVLPESEIRAHFNSGDSVVTLRPAPTANAGDDQPDVPELSEVTLTGSGSTYDGATITSYQWTQTAGTNVTLSDDTAASPTFSAPDVDAITSLTFQLTVTASDGQSSDPDEVTVSVTNLIAPVADAGDDRTVNEGDAVTLDGSGSTEGSGSIVTYAWVQTLGTNVTLTDAETATATFDAPQVDAEAELTFELTVTDANDLSSTATVTITVTDGETPPPPSGGGGGGGGGCFISSML
jgi:hypothetical protein